MKLLDRFLAAKSDRSCSMCIHVRVRLVNVLQGEKEEKKGNRMRLFIIIIDNIC